MNNKSQLLKGSLEGCVLKIIDLKDEIYGYDIARILKDNGFTDISEGTLSSKMKESPLGPARKYYSLTDKGREELKDFVDTWEYMSKNINDIIKGNIQ